MKFLKKYRFFNFAVYFTIFYQSFKVLWISYDFDFKTYEFFLGGEKKVTNYVVTEKKFLVDLKYKKEIYFDKRSFRDNVFVVLDKESKVIGSRFFNSHESLAKHFYVNKKFLHSTLLGSIKLIKL